MKRVFTILLVLSLWIFPVKALAVPTEFSGGVNNEYEYQEYVFLSGEPVKFVGSYTITETENKDKKTINYKFSLKPEDKSLTGKLDRQMTYVVTYTNRNDKGQTIAQTEMTRMRESIDVNDVKFDLEDYQFSKSDIVDNRPVSDFYSGNLKARKYYTVNNDEGEAVVDISGGNVGYENFWGSTDTQIIDYVIRVERQAATEETDEEEEDTDLSWEGTVRVQVSDSMTKELKYSENEATYTSFQGGHLRVTNREMVAMADYNLPKMNDGVPSSTKRKQGTVELSQTMVPKLERLIVPKFKDTAGHWAEEDINKLYSLDVFDESAQFFMPNIPMTRVEFTKAVMRACNIRPEIQEKKTTSSARRNKTPEVSVFKDVSVSDEDYQYIKDAVEKEIIWGVAPEMFKPQDPLTRAQAVVILIRALGFESKAPTPGYYTAFDDDRAIPEWAKDSIYVAREIGLIKGDNYNKVNAGKVLTRAEASALLVNFLKFLENDLQKDYRENIILYN